MRLFKRKPAVDTSDWLVNHNDQLYRDHGRFRVTIVQDGQQWVYRVSDQNAEISAKDSQPFATQELALEAAMDDLRQSPDPSKTFLD